MAGSSSHHTPVKAYYPGYDRYFHHYNFMQSWMKKHYQVLHRSALGNSDSLSSCSCQHSHPANRGGDHVFKVPTVPPSPRTATRTRSLNSSVHSQPKNEEPEFPATQHNQPTGSQTGPRSSRRNKSKSRKRKAKRRRAASSSSDLSNDPHSSGEKFEAALNEDFLKFMQQSAQHKKEREAKKNKESLERMEVDSKGILVADTLRMAAPTEQPGMRRTHEIKLLYGSQSQKVHGMETAQQLCFQQACDRLKPLPWPNIPLRLNFT